MKKNVNRASMNALREFKLSQEENNHNSLVQAYNRIINNSPRIVSKGTKLSPTSLAKEAGVSRGTVYKHTDIITKVNAYKTNPRLSDYQRTKELEAKEEEKLKKTKNLINQLMEDKNKLAQENYRLSIELKDANEKIVTISKKIGLKSVVTIDSKLT